jgi:hypothetical protein
MDLIFVISGNMAAVSVIGIGTTLFLIASGKIKS